MVFTDQEAVQYHMDNEHGIPNVVVVTNIVTQTQSSSNSPPPTAVYKAGITCIGKKEIIISMWNQFHEFFKLYIRWMVELEH